MFREMEREVRGRGVTRGAIEQDREMRRKGREEDERIKESGNEKKNMNMIGGENEMN